MNKASYLLAGLLLSGTSAFAADTGAVVGGAVGAAAGTVIGKKVGGDTGSVLGAAIGAATGVVIGSPNEARAQPASTQTKPAVEMGDNHEHHDRGLHLGERKHKHEEGRGKKHKHEHDD